MVLQATLSCDPCKKDEKEGQLKTCNKCSLLKYCENCAEETVKQHEPVCQKICSLIKEIKSLQDKVDPEVDVEKFVKFIRLNLNYVFHIWYLAELYFSQSLYQAFFNQAIELIRFKSNSKQYVLYHNQVLGSTSLIYYIVMALFYLDQPTKALDTAKFFLKMQNNRKEIKKMIKNLKDGEWLWQSNTNIISDLDKSLPKNPMMPALIPMKIQELLTLQKTKTQPSMLLTALLTYSFVKDLA